MISIEPIPPPREIEAARARRRPDAMKRFGDGKTLPSRDDLKGYEVARQPRWEHQRGKCAYCDRYERLDEQPTEHFRPKLGEHAVLRHRTSTVTTMRELLVICGSSEATIREHLQSFVKAGKVQITGQGLDAAVTWNP